MKTIKLLILTIAIIFASCTKKPNVTPTTKIIPPPVVTTVSTATVYLTAAYLTNGTSTVWYSVNNGAHMPLTVTDSMSGTLTTYNWNAGLEIDNAPIGTVYTIGFVDNGITNISKCVGIQESNPTFSTTIVTDGLTTTNLGNQVTTSTPYNVNYHSVQTQATVTNPQPVNTQISYTVL